MKEIGEDERINNECNMLLMLSLISLIMYFHPVAFANSFLTRWAFLKLDSILSQAIRLGLGVSSLFAFSERFW